MVNLNFVSSETAFMGLAPFLRKSLAGEDLVPLAQTMLTQAQHHVDDANLLMNLSIVLQCIQQRDLALTIQKEALSMRRVYRYAAAEQPVRFRLLLVVVPGDLAANTPLDCLLEQTDIELVFYYVTDGNPFAAPIPEHDAVMVGINECDEHRHVLQQLQTAMRDWPKPVINAPQFIPNTDRHTASMLLQNVPGLLMPPTVRVARRSLELVATGVTELGKQLSDIDYPFIIRPLDSYGGHDLEKIDTAEDLTVYLAKMADKTFFVSNYIDYSGPEGLFRKCRIALIKGKPYICHMAVSSDWMIHYVNAGMYDDAAKRQQEADFMAGFASFAERHASALQTIAERSQLDYLCIDCAETQDGQLLLFEMDHVMVVHAMDPESMFPYKQKVMKQAQDAFRDYLLGLKIDNV